MTTAKIAISIDSKLLHKIDYFVKKSVFKNRSQAIQAAIAETVHHLEKNRLAIECKKLNPALERKMAEEGFDEDMKEWSEY